MTWQHSDISKQLNLTSLTWASKPHWSMCQVMQGEEEETSQLAARNLTAKEQQQLASFRFPKRHHEWLAGRLAVKNAVCQLSNTSLLPKDIAITATEQGKPLALLAGNETMHISISHSGTTAVGLAASLPCGIDIQQLSAALHRVQSRFVLKEEEGILNDLADQHLAALGLLWTAKECLRKSVPIWPLLGFMESAATSVTWHGDTAIISLQPRSRNRSLPETLPTAYAIMQEEHALAVSFLTKN